MSYTTNIPISGDSLGGTRDRIRTNFQLLSSDFAINHITYSKTGAGKHTFLQIPELNTQTPSTIPTTATDEAALFSNPGTNPIETNLFFRGEMDGKVYQLTRADQTNNASFGANSAYGSPPGGFTQKGGWTFLPGGLILQYGFYGGALANSNTVKFLFALTDVLCLNITTIGIRTASSAITNLTTIVGPSPNINGFIFGNSQASTGIYWQAIGV